MQYVVRLCGKKERAKAFEWLEEHGYKVTCSLKGTEYPYSDVIIDYGIVFGGNPTCFAAGKRGGMPWMTWEKWLEEKQAKKLFC